MTLKQKIDSDLIKAIKDGDELLRDTLRGVKSAISNWQIDNLKDAEDPDIISIIKSAVKQRRESITGFNNANRPELAQKEEKEANILYGYLPEQLSDEKISSAIDEELKNHNKDMSSFGEIMKNLKEKIGKQADMAKVATMLKKKLS